MHRKFRLNTLPALLRSRSHERKLLLSEYDCHWMAFAGPQMAHLLHG
jgi:hypothetical protein